MDTRGPLVTTVELIDVFATDVVFTVFISDACGLVVSGEWIPSLVAWGTRDDTDTSEDCICMDGSDIVVPIYVWGSRTNRINVIKQ